jgi:5-methylthioadenosine/S-adenosylhomocysteine deaminase
MERIAIRNADVITLDERGTILRGADLFIEGETIAAVGSAPEFVADTTIDATNHVALPAFFNAHCHAAMTFVRGHAEDLPFPRWLHERIWPAERALSPDLVYWSSALAICEMMRGGVGGFSDHYFHMDGVADLVEQSGLRAGLAWCMFGAGSDREARAELDACLAFIERWQGRASGRLKLLLGPHSPYVCPAPFLARVAELARGRGFPVHLHLAESQDQVVESLRLHGRTPVGHVDALGLLDGPCVAAHCLAVSDADLDLLARRAVTVAHTPITYMKLAMGVNDLSRFASRGIPVAIGTDGPASNGDMDMLAAIRQTVLLQKHERRDPEAMPGDTALRMASRVGARSVGFETCGVLAPGHAADLVLIDMDRPHLLPRHDRVANLVHSARPGDVTHLIVAGRVLYRDGELLTVDEERIRFEAERAALRAAGPGRAS